MASLENLPADQRAVLSLVLQQGRSYDEIAQLLSIERAAVRDRAQAALAALGPPTGIAHEQRALLTDYLLGQLPEGVEDHVRERLAADPGERAWARVIGSELAPLAPARLPEIPDPADAQPEPATTDQRPRSRVGGAILLAAAALVAAAVVVVVIVLGGNGSSSKHSSSATRAAAASTSSAATTTSSASSSARVVAQINLNAPGGHSQAAGIADVLRQGSATGIAIAAQGLAPNSKHPPTAYAVWLYNSAGDSHILGFVNPGVGSNGRLQTAGALPSNAAHYKQLIVTLETRANPRSPGKIVLQGPLSLG